MKQHRSSRSVTLRFVFNVGTLAGCVAVVIFALQRDLSPVAILLRSFVVFVSATLLAALLMALLRQGRRQEESLPDKAST